MNSLIGVGFVIIFILLYMFYFDTPYRRNWIANRLQKLSSQWTNELSYESFLKLIKYAMNDKDRFPQSYALSELSKTVNGMSPISILAVSVIVHQTAHQNPYIRHSAASALSRIHRRDHNLIMMFEPILQQIIDWNKNEFSANIIERVMRNE